MPDFINRLRWGLLALGCPAPRVHRLVREVADHREDLVEAALAEGWSKAEAEVQAEVRLGNPQQLAEDLMVSQRRASWCGRHRFLAFGVLPLLTFPLLWALILCLNLALGFALGFGWSHSRLRDAADNPTTFHYLAIMVNSAAYVAMAVVAGLFCRLAGRSAAGRNWMWLAGLICTAHSLFIHTYFSPHNFAMTISSQPQWIQTLIPLLIFGLAYWNQRRQVRRALKFAVA